MNWLEIEVFDPEGRLCTSKLKVELRLSDGRVKHGTTGSDGKVRFSELPAGQLTLHLPDLK